MINRIEIFLLSTLFINIYGDRVNESLWEPNACEIPETGNNKSLRLLERKIEVNTEYDAEVGQMPWVAILWSSNSTPANITCIGALVNRYYVLSAAACKGNADMIRLGENDLSNEVDCNKSSNCTSPFQDIKIKKYIFPKENSLDVIIELEKPVEYNEFVRPACLPDNTISNRASLDDELIVGWYGQSKLRSGTGLLYTGTRRVSMEKCKEEFPLQDDIAFCVGLSENMADSENGLPNKILGSPVMIKKVTDSNRRSYFISSVVANAAKLKSKKAKGAKIAATTDTAVKAVNKKPSKNPNPKPQVTKTQVEKNAVKNKKC